MDIKTVSLFYLITLIFIVFVLRAVYLVVVKKDDPIKVFKIKKIKAFQWPKNRQERLNIC